MVVELAHHTCTYIHRKRDIQCLIASIAVFVVWSIENGILIVRIFDDLIYPNEIQFLAVRIVRFMVWFELYLMTFTYESEAMHYY